MEEHEAIKGRQREVWSLGDYSQLSESLRPAAVALCDACAVSAGQEVLDVAAGDGNFAISCAYEGASVVATDLSPKMVERGRARSEAEGYDIEWVEADAEELPFEDERFECAGSVFGSMVAPRPEVAARELFRVVRPGNTVGMTAWTPDSFMVELFNVWRRHGPPAGPGQHKAEEWGVEQIVRERFEGLAARIDFEKRALTWEAGSPAELIGKVMESAGPTVAARRTLSSDTFEALLEGLAGRVREHAGGDGPVSVDAEYALIVARRRG